VVTKSQVQISREWCQETQSLAGIQITVGRARKIAGRDERPLCSLRSQLQGTNFLNLVFYFKIYLQDTFVSKTFIFAIYH
jgi:hypothetical protein